MRILWLSAEKKALYWSLIAIIVTTVLSHFFIRGRFFVCDEFRFFGVIYRFLNGSFTYDPMLAMLPGYHAITYLFAKIFQVDTLNGVRLLTTLYGILSALMFYLCAKKLNLQNAPQRTIDYFMLPVLFPFIFLVYTDSLSMLFVLIAFYCYLNSSFTLAAVFCGLGVVVRQTNIIWAAMIFLMIYIDNYSFSLNMKGIKCHIKKCWPFLALALCFVLFVLINGSVAYKDKQAYPLILSVENVFFSLNIFFFLFLPLNIANTRKILTRLKQKPWLLLICFTLFCIYMTMFHPDHVTNKPNFVLTNIAIKAIKSNLTIKVLNFIPIIWALLSIMVCTFYKKSQYMLYPFWLLLLLPLCIVDTRYYIPTLTLFLLFKKPEARIIEWTITAIFYAVSISLFAMIIITDFFP